MAASACTSDSPVYWLPPPGALGDIFLLVDTNIKGFQSLEVVLPSSEEDISGDAHCQRGLRLDVGHKEEPPGLELLQRNHLILSFYC